MYPVATRHVILRRPPALNLVYPPCGGGCPFPTPAHRRQCTPCPMEQLRRPEPVSREVSALAFGFYTAVEARRLSVKRITATEVLDKLDNAVPDGLYDPALGPTDPKGAQSCRLQEAPPPWRVLACWACQTVGSNRPARGQPSRAR